jgi:hypothetical protein
MMSSVLIGSSVSPKGEKDACVCVQCTYDFKITIYAPMIYTAPCIMVWMRAYPLRGQVGGGWALEFVSNLGPVKWPFVLKDLQMYTDKKEMTFSSYIKKFRVE